MESSAILFSVFAYSYYIATFLLGLIAATWIYRDAKSLPVLFLGSRPVWWALIAVIDPIISVSAYWIIHHSSISNRLNERTAA
jgi:hypothetical protein